MRALSVPTAASVPPYPSETHNAFSLGSANLMDSDELLMLRHRKSQTLTYPSWPALMINEDVDDDDDEGKNSISDIGPLCAFSIR